MFTTTNVTSSAVPTGTIVRPSYPLMTNPTTNHHSPSNPSWRVPLPTSANPSVVSILNGNSSTIYITSSTPSQTVRYVSPSLTRISNSNQATITEQTSQLDTSKRTLDEQTTASGQDLDFDSNNQQEPEIELAVNNVVCSFALGCKLNLRKIAMEAANVIYKRDHAMVLMKIRNPYCSANVWSSGKVTVTGTTSEDDAQRAARRVARCLQRLGFKTKFRNYRVVNCLATCSMPWPIDIIKLSRMYPECVSYEPEIHPGATVRLSNKAVLKVFTTGSVTLTAPSVDVINTAVNDFYPQLFECRKVNRTVNA